MKFFYLITLLIISQKLISQNEIDAIRYSQENLGSTARSFGVGGALGAVGADPSCAAINPAGMARYRTSKFYFSTAFYNARNKTNYLGKEIVSNKFNFNLPNVGFIINIKGEDYTEMKPKGFVNFVLGFNLNRLNNFHKTTTMNGQNINNSITQNWAERGTNRGVTTDQFSIYSIEYLAYQAYAIDSIYSPNSPTYRSAYGPTPINVKQASLNESKGALNDYNVLFAANYRHLLQGGITIGFKSVRYNEVDNFVETDLKKSTILDIKSVTLDQDLKTTGTGFNTKLGFVYNPTEFLRIGYSYHSPTAYNLKDSYEYVITSVFDSGAKDSSGQSRLNSTVSTEKTGYKYKIISPSRHVLSFAIINKRIGFISVDMEHVSYSSAKISAKNEDYSAENNKLQENYSSVWNIRTGGELIKDKYRFRAGYARYPSPYKSSIVPDLKVMINNVYTVGFGIKTEKYSFDMAYVNSGYADYYIPYTLASGKQPVATNNVRTTNIVFTIGLNLD